MPGTAFGIGPFSGGLNNFSDPASVNDNELVQVDNFELDMDGSLKSRPPFVTSGMTVPLGASDNAMALGWYTDATSGLHYLILSNGTNTYAWEPISNGFTTIVAYPASAVTQFNGFAYLVFSQASGVAGGGHWSPGAGYTADANLPQGDSIIPYKFRLWISAGKNATSNPTRMYYSNVLGSSTFWPASPNFIDVGGGDGQSLVALYPYYGTMLVFRTDSVYSFSYGSDPASGTVLPVLPTIGLENVWCLAASEAYLYFMYRGRLYEFINNRANQINPKVVFRAGSQTGIFQPFAVSIFNKRTIVSFYDTMYVFNLITRTWTTWTSPTFASIGAMFMSASNSGNLVQAYTISSTAVAAGGTRVAPILSITDGFSANAIETMTSKITTKNYNYNAASQFKRLFWWGVDATFRSVLRVIVTPVTANFSITYGQLRTSTYGQLRSGTYAHMLQVPINITDSVDESGASVLRRFVKMLKSLRFRQINFQVAFDHDGSTGSSPVRLYTLMTYVLVKEHASEKVS